MNRSAAESIAISHPQDQLIQLISGWIAPLGYQVVHLELQLHRQKVLRVYIDFLNPAEKAIGIEDCVRVSRTLDELLDQASEVQSLLPGTYELEVSSPGVDRPLRTGQDFQRFAGREVRIHLYRPMTSEELGNADYQAKNPKQKNFVGTLVGLDQDKVVLLVTFPVSSSLSNKDKGSQKSGKKSKAKKAGLTTNSEEGTQVTIPLPLISKANLEPQFDFEGSDEREIEL